MNSESKEKTLRMQLSKVTNILISPARIRRFLDDAGINKNIEKELDRLRNELLKLKKEGLPAQKPTDPEELKKYEDYTSEKYKKLETVYGLCKVLLKIHSLLVKRTKGSGHAAELEELYAAAQDKPAPRKTDPKTGQAESEEVYNTRVKKFEPAGFAAYLGSTDLTNPDTVVGLYNTLKKSYEEVNLFLQRDEVSKSRIRFNDPAAVALATAMELAIEELLEHGMTKTLESKLKTIQPDHCVSPGMENCNWFVFFRNLPHLKNIVERQKRKLQWTEERDKAKKKALQEARLRKKGKKTVQVPKFKYVSFNDDEVAKGYAVCNTHEVVESNGTTTTKTQYQWYGIDIERTGEPDDSTNFYFYVQQVCKKIINHRSETDPDFSEIKISTNIRKFFSDLIVDFIARIAPLIRELISAMDVKTVDQFVIKTVLRMLLIDNYHSSTGFVKLNEDHELLFTLIDEKVQLCQNHQTTHRHEPTEAELKELKAETGHEDDPTEVSVSKPKSETSDIVSDTHKMKNGNTTQVNGNTAPVNGNTAQVNGNTAPVNGKSEVHVNEAPVKEASAKPVQRTRQPGKLKAGLQTAQA